jgi:hypothetical protein
MLHYLSKRPVDTLQQRIKSILPVRPRAHISDVMLQCSIGFQPVFCSHQHYGNDAFDLARHLEFSIKVSGFTV